jgi:hypothetical protein
MNNEIQQVVVMGDNPAGERNGENGENHVTFPTTATVAVMAPTATTSTMPSTSAATEEKSENEILKQTLRTTRKRSYGETKDLGSEDHEGVLRRITTLIETSYRQMAEEAREAKAAKEGIRQCYSTSAKKNDARLKNMASLLEKSEAEKEMWKAKCKEYERIHGTIPEVVGSPMTEDYRNDMRRFNVPATPRHEPEASMGAPREVQTPTPREAKGKGQGKRSSRK